MAAGDPTPPDFGRNPVDLEKYRSVGIHPTDRSGTTRTITDENGHKIIHHADDDSRQDVVINAKPVQVGVKVQPSS